MSATARYGHSSSLILHSIAASLEDRILSALHATVKASAAGLGVMATYRDLGETYYGKVWADASAALGIIQRRGLGKVRHIDTHHLWIQEVAAKKKLKYGKIAGEKNCADLLTKHLDQATMTKHLKTLDIEMNKEGSRLALDIKAVSRTNGEEEAEEEGDY